MASSNDALKKLAKHEKKVETIQRAIGRYILEFAELVTRMRQPMEERLRRPEDSPELMSIMFGDMTAAPVAQIFFGLCKTIGNLKGDEEKVWTTLMKKVVYEAIPRRNDISHGDWFIELSEFIMPKGPRTYYTRTKSKAGQGRICTPISPQALDKLSDEVRSLTATVHEFGLICFGLHPLQKDGSHPDLRVSDIFAMTGPKGKRCVARAGPVASKIYMGP